MAALILLAFALAGGLAIAAVWRATGPGRELPPAERRALAREARQSARLLASSVRLFERGLSDPIYRQSEEWREEASSIVDEYYEGD